MNILHLFLNTVPLSLYLRIIHSLVLIKLATYTLELQNFSLPVSKSNILTSKNKQDEKNIFHLDYLLCFIPKKE